MKIAHTLNGLQVLVYLKYGEFFLGKKVLQGCAGLFQKKKEYQNKKKLKKNTRQ